MVIRCENRSLRPYQEGATFLHDGIVSIPDADALVEFTGRTLAQICGFMLEQLPQRMEAKLDVQAFLGAFSYKDDSGNTHRLKKWDTAPFYDPAASCTS